MNHPAALRLLLFLIILFFGSLSFAETTPLTPTFDDDVARLQRQIEKGEVTLTHDEEFGYLPDVLRKLNMPVSSQSLVFSKTSLQTSLISPSQPRALYFNDETYVGYVQGGDLEFAAVDPKQGTIFYTLDQTKQAAPKFVRQTESCFQCHNTSLMREVPSMLLRSVVPDHNGQPILSAGTSRVNQDLPFAKRWGGWYVTGTHGDQRHIGNTIFNSETDAFEASQRAANGNRNDLSNLFDVTQYPTPSSDLVALLVLEHQTEMHNLMSRAAIQVADALEAERAINGILKGPRPAGYSESTTRRIKSAGDSVLRYMLFANEAKFTAPVKGNTDYAKDFSSRGPRDSKGRSLRDFDLQSRVFKYPCSFLIYSEQFDALPQPLLDYIYQQLWRITHEKEKGRDFDSLTTDDRDAIREILLETKKGLPDYWRYEPSRK